ncbi:large-conductance mechanosensitive channel protein MscL [Acetanaerobacterium elongatum]|uniref:Large-conductance mechanosensitive channel n=1 Tax=Acetanaerobacterium elongatum TaxID=258515 RepID=A0A1G9U659_9FIRM|nr:large-conductance mechanosensitive channel protein MscL [Acetanaerobacterium elongatum]SDM55460.1 large conductance mechanosensitive channel [Acetanaerobacterium elongatum]
MAVDMNKAKETIKKNGRIVGEFKEFISRGNVVDMAVGIIVGSAFTAIVNSLVNDILMPVIGYFISGIKFSDMSYALPVINGGKAVLINYGMFLQKIVDFLLIALVVFFMVKLLNRLRRKKEEKPAEPPKPVLTKEAELLTEIRDLLKKG